MLAFFDESGHPHPKDHSTRPVCVAVCISEKDARFIGGRIHALKRDLLKLEELEIKAQNLLNRGTFRRIPEKREFVEAYFDLLRGLPITIFAIIMERPLTIPVTGPNYLPNQFRYLLQRCELLVRERNEMVTVLFDGDETSLHGGLALKFNSFIYRSQEGRAMANITDAPFFVDSKITAGIQIADMASGVIRLHQENTLSRSVPVRDAFLSAIRRYYQIVEAKTVDLKSPEGYPRPGFYYMPEQDHYSIPATQESFEDTPTN